MKYKILVFTFIFCFSFLFLSSAFLAWFVDPLKLFHKPFLCENTIYDSARYSVRGMIDTMDFDSVILGTSMLENTSAKEANDKLNGNFINISISGSSLFERKIILDYLLKRKDIKYVFYSLDKFHIIRKENFISAHYQLDKYRFLYDDNLFNDFKAYLNIKYIGYMLKTFVTFGKKCKIYDFYRPFAWYMFENDKQRFGGIENWAKHNNNQLKEDIIRIEKVLNGKIEKTNNLSFKENLDNNIIYFAKKYSQTNFIWLF